MIETRDKAFRRGRAFSLIELVMVVFIVATIAAIARPRYVNSLSSYRAGMAAKRVAADLAYARSNAWSTGVSQVVTFTQASNQYQLAGMKGLDNSANNFIVTLSSDPYYATINSASFGGSASVTFDAYGFPNQGGQVVVTAGGFQKTITLDQASGNVTVQ
jgi:prepilin-type N-terminal cleavage/methylation domain-containing protein